MKNPYLEVLPSIPQALARLSELAGNLFFSWNRPARVLFEELDRELWKQTNGNPRLLLRCLPQHALERAAADAEYIGKYHQVLRTFDAYMSAAAPRAEEFVTAYFCAEYGFHESFPIYSGGLGILAGDYCKAASDERTSFVAVGLLYGQGYFTQTVDNDGNQLAEYREQDPRNQPVEPVRDSAGAWIEITQRIAGREVVARVWKAQVGRVCVYLLDTNCAQNAPSDRDITHRLYGGDESTRIRQEMILGISGVRVLRKLGLDPSVWHMNEGHAAFLILELLREHLGKGLSFGAALEAVAAQCVFTTHTPVAAGHDTFSRDLVLAHFEEMIRELGISPDRFMELAAAPNAPGWFNMTRLGLTGSRRVNGVSRIHGRVSARLLADQWPEIRPEENPVGFVTNGVHVPTFLHQTWADFFDRHLSADWRDHLSSPTTWEPLASVPDDAFWQASQSVKAQMLNGVRERVQREYAHKGLSAAQCRHAVRLLDPSNPNVLTLGFARRFATYKRASLLLRDRARLARLIERADRPVLFLFAGKAHPADEPGKQVLREIKQTMMSPQFAGRVIFLEDYDLQLARWLVSGVDVWLNNPIAPLEASGTSGIKAAVNGRQNLSVLDGWWAEGWTQDNGWGIPSADMRDADRRDDADADLLMETIEQDVLPLYYSHDSEGLPVEWIRRSKRALSTVIPRFNMRRVLQDYSEALYRPATVCRQRLAADNFAGARALAEWKQRVRLAWPKVGLRPMDDAPTELPQAGRLKARVAAALNGLQPADVRVEFVARRSLPEASFEPPPLSSYRESRPEGLWSSPLASTAIVEPDGAFVFELDAAPPACGQFAIEIRVFPFHELLSHPHEMGLMRWL